MRYTIVNIFYQLKYTILQNLFARNHLFLPQPI